MIHIDCLCERLNIPLFSLIKVSNLNLKLKTLKIVQILKQVILFKQLKSKSLILFHVAKSLLILNSLIKILLTHDLLLLFLGVKYLRELIQLLL